MLIFQTRRFLKVMKKENNTKANLIKSMAVPASAMIVLSGASAVILANDDVNPVPVIEEPAPEIGRAHV